MPVDYTVQSTRSVSIGGGNSASVTTPTPTYFEMANRWVLIDDLLEGTARMRERGEMWLPREPAELPGNFKKRLQRSFLYGALADTIERLVSDPFSKPIDIPVDAGNEQLDAIKDDADGEGTDITQLGRQLFDDLLTYGKCHLWTDYPDTGGNLNLAQESELEVRPYISRVDPHDLIGWRSVKEDGVERLTQVRIVEYRNESDGEYGEKQVKIIWVYNQENTGSEVMFEKHVVQDDGTTVKMSEGAMSITRIPLVTVYAKKRRFMISYPPLEKLAELNLAHWQSSSDQRNILRFARIGMIAMTGISQDEMDNPQVVAPNASLKSVNPDAKFYYVEHGGKAIEAGEKDLQHLEEQMEVLGQQPMVARSSASTATGVVSNESKSESAMQTWVRSMENGLLEAYRIAGEWIKAELPEDFAINIFSDFTIVNGDPSDKDFLIKARAQGDITRERFLLEGKRRGIFGEDMDVEAEAAESDEEQKELLKQTAGATDPFGNPIEPDDEETEDEDTPPAAVPPAKKKPAFPPAKK